MKPMYRSNISTFDNTSGMQTYEHLEALANKRLYAIDMDAKELKLYSSFYALENGWR